MDGETSQARAFVREDIAHELIELINTQANTALEVMVRTIVAGTTSAITMGMAGSGLASAIFGTASLPFLVFACAGFVFGTIGFYRNCLARSLIALERAPGLMQLHLDANYPDKGFLRYSAHQLRRETFSRSWILQSMVISSWLTAQPALDVRRYLCCVTHPLNRTQHLLEAQEQVLTAGTEETMVASQAEVK